MNIARYGVLRHQPYPNRSEHLNIGLAVFMPDGSLRIHMAANLRKLKAFDPHADIDTLRGWERDLPAMLAHQSTEVMRHTLGHFGTLRLSETLGELAYHDEHSYTQRIAQSLESLTEPRTKPSVAREPQSRLFIDIKRSFEALGWLSANPTDIAKHKIIPRYPIAKDEGVTAEFALRNGKLHVIETLDFRVSTAAAKNLEARSKALVFDLAHDIEGVPIMSYVVIAGGQMDEAKSAIKLMQRYAENVCHWEDKGDMDGLINTLSTAIGQSPLRIPPI